MAWFRFPSEGRRAPRATRHEPTCYRRVWHICWHGPSLSRQLGAHPDFSYQTQWNPKALDRAEPRATGRNRKRYSEHHCVTAQTRPHVSRERWWVTRLLCVQFLLVGPRVTKFWL